MGLEKDKQLVVLRLGHRPFRDKRITSHIGLVARAFGADGLLLSVADDSVVKSLEDVRERWGGDFFIKFVKDWREYILDWQGVVVHLTMYGLPVDEKIDGIVSVDKNVLVVVGAEKVPPELYSLSHYNIAVGSQPHSEVAALAIFLDRYFSGEQLKSEFKGRTKIIPSGSGKNVVVE